MIEKNEEILVSYGIGYWVNETKKNPNCYDDTFKNTIIIISKIINITQKYCNSEIYEYKGLFDNKIYFELGKKERLCNYSNKIHYDENFYISLRWKEDEKSILQMYYVCKSCEMLDFVFLIKELENGLLDE